MRTAVSSTLILLLALANQKHGSDMPFDNLLHLHVALFSGQLDGRGATRLWPMDIGHRIQQQFTNQNVPGTCCQLERGHACVGARLVHGEANGYELPNHASAAPVGGQAQGLANHGKVCPVSYELQHRRCIVAPSRLEEMLSDSRISTGAVSDASGEFHIVVELDLLILAQCPSDLQLLEKTSGRAETVLNADHVHGCRRQLATGAAATSPRNDRVPHGSRQGATAPWVAYGATGRFA
mmetsp:Transcript_31478/g.90974  ORF Transcript_31478/g.90974 Transcript_31478/m.90974 type:complete len:238 (-) Transcript_31478:12-725(-)